MTKVNTTLTVHGKRVHPYHMDSRDGCLYLISGGKYKLTLEIRYYTVGYRVRLFEETLYTMPNEDVNPISDSGLISPDEVQEEVDRITDIYLPKE